MNGLKRNVVTLHVHIVRIDQRLHMKHIGEVIYQQEVLMRGKCGEETIIIIKKLVSFAGIENSAILSGGFYMSREEILEKRREENRNKDIYEQEVVKQASTSAVIVMAVLATIFFAVQIFVGGGANWGMGALVFSASMTSFWARYKKFRRKSELLIAVAYTMLVFACSVCYIYNLIVSSGTL